MLEGHFGGWAAVRRRCVTVVGGTAADSGLSQLHTSQLHSFGAESEKMLELLLALSMLMS